MIERFVRWFLRAYPAEKRKRYGDEIVETVLARVRRARRASSVFALVWLIVRECIGVLVAGVTLRYPRESVTTSRTRRRRGASKMDLFLHDFRVAVRGLIRQPAFSVVAVLALALGIGAAVAIFSVFHAVVLKPLPFDEPSRLVAVWEKNPERGWQQAQVAAANYLDWREDAESFTDMAAYNDWIDEKVLLQDGEPVVVLGSEVTGNFFAVLGVAPMAGRVFDEGHTWAGSEPVVVLSHGFWSRQFGADRSIVGRTIELDSTAHRVIGVMPEGFDYPFRTADVWLPVRWEPELTTQAWFRRAHGMRVVGRLADGVSLDEAAVELAAIASRLELDYPETNENMGNGITPLHEWVVGDASRPLQILMAAVGILLLIACANVSNMLLARTSSRADELRIRSALGGARWRLVLQGLMESVLLAVLGGGLGLLLGIFAIGPLLLLSPESLPRIGEITVEPSIVLLAIAVSVFTGLLLGAVPAWRGASLGLVSGARGASSSRRTRDASGFLVALEVALTIPLVVGAGLMVRTLSHLSEVEPGFVGDDVVVASLMAPASSYESDERIVQLYRAIHEGMRGIPGVDEASMSSRLPFVSQRWSSGFTTEGWPAERFALGVRHDEIMPGLFRTMGVPLLRGRDFDLGDGLDAEPVVIINEALAETYFPGEDPLGKRVTLSRTPDASSTWRTIVGVVANVRRETLSVEEKPSFYAPVLQDTTRKMHVLIRSERDLASLLASARERVAAIDPTLPLFDVTTLEAELAASVGKERYLLVLLTLAAVVALLLASVGIFGVVWYATTRRVREIGIRMALGARAGAVMALVIRGGLRPVVLGAAVGVVAAGVMARTMSSLLFEVEPLDPLTFAVVLAIVLVSATGACVLPARWATRVDQTSALRAE